MTQVFRHSHMASSPSSSKLFRREKSPLSITEYCEKFTRLKRNYISQQYILKFYLDLEAGKIKREVIETRIATCRSNIDNYDLMYKRLLSLKQRNPPGAPRSVEFSDAIIDTRMIDIQKYLKEEADNLWGQQRILDSYNTYNVEKKLATQQKLSKFQLKLAILISNPPNALCQNCGKQESFNDTTCRFEPHHVPCSNPQNCICIPQCGWQCIKRRTKRTTREYPEEELSGFKHLCLH